MAFAAASPGQPADVSGASIADIETLQAAVAAAPALADAERSALQEKLAGASALLQQATQETTRAQAYGDALQNSEREVARYQALIDAMDAQPAASSDPLDDFTTIEALQGEIDRLDAERAAVSAQRSAVLEQLARNQKPDEDLAQQAASIRDTLDKLPANDAQPVADLEGRVERVSTQARRQKLRAEQLRIDAQLRGGPYLDQILTAQRGWQDAVINRLDARLAALRSAATELRESSVLAEMAATRELSGEFADKRPALAVFARENLDLGAMQRGFTRDLEQAQADLTQLRNYLAYIEEDSNLTRRRLAVAGLEAEFGQVMLSRLASLPDVRNMQASYTRRNSQIAEVSLKLIDIEEALRSSTEKNRFISAQFSDLADWDTASLNALDQLYAQRRALLLAGVDTGNTLLRMLVDSNTTAQQVIDTTHAYENLLIGNLLWTRDYSYVSLPRLMFQLRELANPVIPMQALQRLPNALTQARTLALTALLVALLLLHRRIRSALRHALGKPVSPRDESVGKILRTVGLTFIYVLPIPLFLLILGQVLDTAGAEFFRLSGIAAALKATALVIFAIALLRTLGGRFGVGRRLLKWNSQRIDTLGRELHWASAVLLPSTAVATYAIVASPTDSGSALAACGTLTTAAVLTVLGWRLLRSDALAGKKLTRAILQASILIAAGVVAMHLTGHLFAAHVYLRALAYSIAAVAVIMFITNTTGRCLVLIRADLERRAREDAKQLMKDEEALNSQLDAATVTSLSEAYTQLLALVRFAGIAFALWVIWSPALPVLSVLDQISLWRVSDATLPEGEFKIVSLATVLIALAVIAITGLATRHVPPLVKLMLMEWTKVTAGSRYAIGMLMQYVIVGVGLSITLTMLGWEWAKVQWLVAALGVGIGFGLQEIVANFISGIILLFERPIRVGDIISAGGGEGTVTRINPRATVIESFEGKELMIPNKELITSVVINWSLSSSTLRVVIPVGVAYGSDVRQAMRILLEVAADNPSVLKDPKPSATFEDFADNALTLWLRCYAGGEYPRVWTELRTEINDRFNAAGISIAFPQRDVHLDASRPIPVQVVTPGDA